MSSYDLAKAVLARAGIRTVFRGGAAFRSLGRAPIGNSGRDPSNAIATASNAADALIIHTPRLILRSVVAADAPALLEIGSGSDVARMAGQLPHPLSVDTLTSWIAALPCSDHDGRALAVMADGDLVGLVGYSPESYDTFGIGYMIGEPYWGQGFATEAARAMIGHCLATAPQINIVAAHFHDNAASARVLAKLGFTLVSASHGWCPVRRCHMPTMLYVLSHARAAAIPRLKALAS